MQRARAFHRLGKAEKLRSRSEFRSVAKCAKKRYGSFLVVSVSHPHSPCRRVGLIVSKSVGNAVQRNRVKRRLREIWRHLKSDLPLCDIILRATPAAANATYQQLLREIEREIPAIQAFLQQTAPCAKK